MNLSLIKVKMLYLKVQKKLKRRQNLYRSSTEEAGTEMAIPAKMGGSGIN